MERMQLQSRNLSPAPGRRGVSPASQNSSSSSSRTSALLHRRRDSSQPRSQSRDRKSSSVQSFTLPPLSIHTQSKQRISLMPDLSSAKLSEVKLPAQSGTKKPDRDALPSMQRAATALESSNLKMVSFAPEDGNESDSSSICHSPTWDDYGKKKRKEPETKRKRLTKEPPPAAAENRPFMSTRARSDSTLSIQQLRQCLESGNASQQLSNAASEASIPLPVESIDAVTRSPGFIGGVRLEREREAAMQRLKDSRASSIERPASEMMLHNPTQSQSKTELAKKRETAPPTSYPPTSSKTYFLTDSRPPRTRRNSLGQGLKNAAGKLFSSRDKDSRNSQDLNKRNESRASVETVQTLYGTSEDRGRQMKGSATPQSRHQSYDSHQRDASQKDERRGAVSLPPVTWKNKKNKLRTISMMAAPPDSARDGSFSPSHSSPLNVDDFGFLERPFSPPNAPPMSPPGSMSPSLKAKMSPIITPTSVPSSTGQSSSKKTFKEALKAGFRHSSSQIIDSKPARRRSGTLDTLVGTDTEMSLPARDSPALQSTPTTVASGTSASSAQIPRQSTERRAGQAQSSVDLKDSGASSSSSHHDSESQVPSPMTTPEGSRPQSSKDNKAFRLDEVQRIPPLSYENVIAMRGSPTLPPAGYLVQKKPQSPRMSVEQPRGSPQAITPQATTPKATTPKATTPGQHGQACSNAAEDLSSNKSFLTDELWSQSRRPLDPDQLSFTSALTSIDVKRSFVDLNSALQSSNGDVTPLSLEQPSPTVTTNQKETPPPSMGFQFDLSSKGSHTSLPPPSPSSIRSPYMNSRPPQGHGQLPTKKADRELSSLTQVRTNSPDLRTHPVRKASDYLEEARKAAPASPRAPASTTSSQTSLSNTSKIITTPRSFALGKPQSPAASTTAALSPLSFHPVKRPSTQEPTPLGTPVSKMLVECCHCKFYHDMPSRVYEAMARPDDIVKDKKLGVSGQVTTCVKCPWCSHNMSTMCCAGYAAIVYLQEKLHGP